MILVRCLAGLGLLALLAAPADAATHRHHGKHHARISTATYRAHKPVPHRYHASVHRRTHTA